MSLALMPTTLRLYDIALYLQLSKQTSSRSYPRTWNSVLQLISYSYAGKTNYVFCRVGSDEAGECVIDGWLVNGYVPLPKRTRRQVSDQAQAPSLFLWK